jgi:hypothetical protein|tara:strand:+ start:1480 stop:1881 length:402 start_codon:yes stop_codon:yes gene_type:complete
MSKFKVVLGWVGIVILGLAHGVLEDLMFVRVLVEYIPASVDLTGDLFFIFTVPLAQLMTFVITGTLAWHFLGLRNLPRLITFWACWIVARTAFLVFAQNPVGDIAIYLAWITLWCFLVGLYARSKNQAQDRGR